MNNSPAQLAQLINAQKYNLVENEIISFIVNSSARTNYIKISSPSSVLTMNPISHEQQCINLVGSYATVIVRLFCAQNYAPSNKILDIFLTKKQTLEYVFSLSAWRTTDPIIEKLALLNVLDKIDSQSNSKTRQVVKLLLALYVIGSKYDLPWSKLFRFNSNITLYAFIGLLNKSIAASTPTQNNRLNQLLASASTFPIVTLRDQNEAYSLVEPYFNCSYATGEKKYELKKWISKVISTNIKNWLPAEVSSYIENCKASEISTTPTICVILEKYHLTHAMYRCYNTILRNLGNEYRLIACIEKENDVEYSFEAFSEVVFFTKEDKLKNRVQKIVELSPDIIYYPSIGMGNWTTCLASLRLAPIQFMTSGHPSTSHSDAIDYFIMTESSFSTENLQDFISEEVIINHKSNSSMNYVTRHPLLTDDFINNASEYLPFKEEVKIGINGILRKVSSEVIEVCEEINKKSTKKLKFLFFSMYPQYHVGYLSEKIFLTSTSLNIELASYSDYISYMKKLSSCHFLLPTFPFGGSNSNVDAMILAKPKLFLYQNRELYTRADELDWTLVGMENYFGCRSKQELIDKSLTYINDEQALKETSMLMKEKCGPDVIFSKSEDENSCTINGLVKQMLELHQTNAVCES